ncbi:MAG: hypothetical protein IJY62_03725 [Clostridia bacterium]|nr:hypothetical protein [Clostridia bacterium]
MFKAQKAAYCKPQIECLTFACEAVRTSGETNIREDKDVFGDDTYSVLPSVNEEVGA